jgi:hypothetical protein
MLSINSYSGKHMRCCRPTHIQPNTCVQMLSTNSYSAKHMRTDVGDQLIFRQTHACRCCRPTHIQAKMIMKTSRNYVAKAGIKMHTYTCVQMLSTDSYRDRPVHGNKPPATTVTFYNGRPQVCMCYIHTHMHACI